MLGLGLGAAMLAPHAAARYQARMRRLFGTSLIALWAMDDAVGSTTMLDVSGNGRNGTHTNVMLGAAGIGDGSSSASYNGTTSYSNAYSASLAAAFNGAEGTLACWVRVSGAGVWTDGIARRLAFFAADGSNYVRIFRSSVNGRIDLQYNAGGTIKAVSVTGLTSLDWLHFVLTWSADGDAATGYLNGEQQGVTQTALGTWAGSLAATTTVIGSASTTPAGVWSGTIDLPLILDRAATAAEIAQAARI